MEKTRVGQKRYVKKQVTPSGGRKIGGPMEESKDNFEKIEVTGTPIKKWGNMERGGNSFFKKKGIAT